MKKFIAKNNNVESICVVYKYSSKKDVNDFIEQFNPNTFVAESYQKSNGKFTSKLVMSFCYDTENDETITVTLRTNTYLVFPVKVPVGYGSILEPYVVSNDVFTDEFEIIADCSNIEDLKPNYDNVKNIINTISNEKNVDEIEENKDQKCEQEDNKHYEDLHNAVEKLINGMVNDTMNKNDKNIDETTKLKNEIQELKDENERLKKSLDKLEDVKRELDFFKQYIKSNNI